MTDREEKAMRKLHEQRLAGDFIRLHCKGMRVTAQEGQEEMLKYWGVSVDWHEFVTVLGDMRSVGDAERVALTSSRQVIYRIK